MLSGAMTYPISIPIDTNRGRGETRAIGPTSVTFSTTALFEVGETLRFSMSLRGTASMHVEVFCDGRVTRVIPDGERFVVEASIDQMRLTN